MSKESKRGGQLLMNDVEKPDAYERVSTLLKYELDINYQNDEKNTALHITAMQGRDKVVQLLCANGADKEIQNKDGNTPLHLAAFNGHMAACQALLDAGANKETLNNIEAKPLYFAAGRGHADVVRLMIKAGCDKEGKNEYGNRAIHHSCGKGQLNVVKALIEEGVELQPRNNLKNTPIHFAALFDRAEVVSALLAAGADIEIRDQDGNTPLHKAADAGKEETVLLLVSKGADKEARNITGASPMMIACMTGQEVSVRRLIEHGSDITAKNQYGNGPLHLAAIYGRASVVPALLEAGIDVNAQAEHDENPLMMATKHGKDAVIDLLIDKTVDKEARDEYNNTALLLAAGNGHYGASRRLIQAGASVHAENRWRNTSLHRAAMNNRLEVVTLLLESGAKVDARADLESTALHMAADRGHRTIVKVLLEHGADITSRRSDGLTPRDLASKLTDNDLKDQILLLLDNPPLFKATQSKQQLSIKQTPPVEDDPGRRLVAEGLRAHSTYWYSNKMYSAFLERRCSVYDMIYGSHLEDVKQEIKQNYLRTAGGTEVMMKWIHIPHNNKVWLTHILQKISAVENRDRKYHQIVQGFVNSGFYEHKGSTTHSFFMKPNSQAFKGKHGSEGENISVVTLTMPYLISETMTEFEKHRLALRHTNGNPRDTSGDGAQTSQASDVQSLYQNYHVPSELHTPRTLDQFYYHELDNTDMRDADQVVYRFTSKTHDHNRSEINQPFKRHRTEATMVNDGPPNPTTKKGQTSFHSEEKDRSDRDSKKAQSHSRGQSDMFDGEQPQILMLNQLWLVMIDQRTVVTLFPGSLSAEDSLVNSIRAKYEEVDVSSPKELLTLIATQSSNFIEPPHNGGLNHSLFRIFASSIADVANQEANLYSKFRNLIQKSSTTKQRKQQQNSFSKTTKNMATPNLVEEENLISSNNDMEISSEIELLVTIKDIQDELGMIEKVLNEQGDTVKRLPDLLPDDQSNGNLDEFDRDANYRTQTVNTQLEDANRVERSLNHLLDLKQKQVNINEAVSSRKQAESTAMQGNYIMVFTIVTVIFSPLSFMAGLFALDISYFPHDSEGDVKFNSGWVTLRLILGTIGTLIFVAFAIVMAFYLNSRSAVKSGRRKNQRSDGTGFSPLSIRNSFRVRKAHSQPKTPNARQTRQRTWLSKNRVESDEESRVS